MLTLTNKRKKTGEKHTARLVKDYNTGFRVVYNNMDRLKDPIFNEQIKQKYTHSVRSYDDLLADVKEFSKKQEGLDDEKTNRITKLKCELLDKNITEKERQKILNKIDLLESSIRRGVTFGSKTLQRQVTRLHERLKDIALTDDERIELEENLRERQVEFKNRRSWMVPFYGEAIRKGNRFFDFSRLGSGIVICKVEATDIKFEIPFEIRGRKNKNLYMRLQKAAMNCEMPITVLLSEDEIYFSYDETILNGTTHDTKRLEIKLRKDKSLSDERKQQIRIENHKAHDKINQERHSLMPLRFIGIDSNPDGIGICIADQDDPTDVSGKFQRDVLRRFLEIDDMENLPTEEQHKKIEMIAKELVKEALHYKCFNFVIETLKFEKTNRGNAKSNRKINNLWFRTKLFAGITKWCNIFGIKLNEIHTAYTSFIGNILHEEYDPVAASIEICRRGMIKFIPDSDFYPSINLNELQLSSIGISNFEFVKLYEMYEERRSNGSSIRTWEELYRLMKGPGVSVRRNNLAAFEYRCRSRTILLRNSKGKFKVYDFDPIHKFL